MNRFYLICFLVTLLAGAGCKRVKTQTPEVQAYEPAIPDPVSYLAGRVSFPIPTLERKVNQALKPMLVTEETFHGKKGEAWRLRVERTGPVQIHYANQKAFFSAPLRVLYSNPIGLRKQKKSRTLCELSVNFASPLSVGANWRLTTRSRLDNYKWIRKPAIRLLGIQINITGLAEKILKNRRAEIEKAIDQAVHDELKLDKEVAKVWRDLQKPLRISKSPGEVWLMPKPFSVAVAPVEGNAHELIIPLRIAFRVGTHIGTEPTLDKLEPLPRLMRRERVTDQSSLHVLSFVAYSDINRILHKTIVEKKPGLPGGRLRIEDAEVMGGGTSLIMKTKIKGLMNGTLYFRGQPHYDTLTNTLRIQQVDYDVETKETLLETADWLLHDNLRDTLQSALVIPLQKGITELPGKIEQAFARGGAGKKTALDIDSFRLVPRKIVIRPDGVQVLIHVDSKVKIAVQRI